MSIKILGLTGPSGAGKGTACKIFEKYGIPAIDTDAVYHTLLQEDASITAELADAFGYTIIDENGRVDRKKLGAVVFGQKNTPALLHTLNTITHKYVMARTWALVCEIEKTGARAVLIDAPQLFEAGIEQSCDAVIGVLADRQIRLSRIMQRDGLGEEAALNRINAQHDDAFFRHACLYILENNESEAALEQQIRELLIHSGVGL